MNGKHYNYTMTRFVKSASDARDLPKDTGIEIAFVGRSNVGKSSALNALTNQRNLARISKTPGRTQLINLFEVETDRRLVDLPGFGYAKVSKDIKLRWQHTLSKYLQVRNCLKGLMLLMDIRHPLRELDQQIVQWGVSAKMPILLLLTKADKLNFEARKFQLNTVRGALLPLMADITVEIFSAKKKIGTDKLSEKLDLWMRDDFFRGRPSKIRVRRPLTPSM